MYYMIKKGFTFYPKLELGPDVLSKTSSQRMSFIVVGVDEQVKDPRSAVVNKRSYVRRGKLGKG